MSVHWRSALCFTLGDIADALRGYPGSASFHKSSPTSFSSRDRALPVVTEVDDGRVIRTTPLARVAVRGWGPVRPGVGKLRVGGADKPGLGLGGGSLDPLKLASQLEQLRRWCMEEPTEIHEVGVGSGLGSPEPFELVTSRSGSTALVFVPRPGLFDPARYHAERELQDADDAEAARAEREIEQEREDAARAFRLQWAQDLVPQPRMKP